MSQIVRIIISDSLAYSHNCFIELNIKATGSYVFDLGNKFYFCDKKVGGLEPSGLIEVYAYAITILSINTKC